MKFIVIILSCVLSLSVLPVVGSTQDKMKSRERVLKAINDPAEARKLRQWAKNATGKDLKDIAEMKESIAKAINDTNSSLPKQIDSDTNCVSLTTSGDNIIYKFSLLNNGPTFQNKNKVMSEAKTRTTNHFCTTHIALWVILGYTVIIPTIKKMANITVDLS